MTMPLVVWSTSVNFVYCSNKVWAQLGLQRCGSLSRCEFVENVSPLKANFACAFFPLVRTVCSREDNETVQLTDFVL